MGVGVNQQPKVPGRGRLVQRALWAVSVLILRGPSLREGTEGPLRGSGLLCEAHLPPRWRSHGLGLEGGCETKSAQKPRPLPRVLELPLRSCCLPVWPRTSHVPLGHTELGSRVQMPGGCPVPGHCRASVAPRRRGTERFSNLSKVTQLGSGDAGARTPQPARPGLVHPTLGSWLAWPPFPVPSLSSPVLGPEASSSRDRL